ncbi:MAG: UDP-N-acetylmuramoyl-L-alanyl-D-glutamate--2,6-diaminopimelate ligase [Burkholderiaceae bacterium]|nr:UDP-N-acetylmuramoyl-L-alanyl-D-glutamate--2,6-diaminopimelate ligase [Burkholderiaceae bacterium]
MIEHHSPQECAQWLHSRVTGVLHTDSRKVKTGDGFIAWPGAITDGRQYVAQALLQGASACIVEKNGLSKYAMCDEHAIACYSNLKSATGLIAAEYYEHPTQSVDVIAITGTNGKTSSAWWLAQALSLAKTTPPKNCGMVGTLGIGQPPLSNDKSDQSSSIVMTGLTTPDPVLLQQEFRNFVNANFAACAIEASSIGLAENRLDGTVIKVAVFTNFTQDHLDYHGSMDAYWQAKLKLFFWPSLQAAVINIDDPKGRELLTVLEHHAVELWSISITGPARLRAHDICYVENGLQFNVTEDGATHRIRTSMIGNYNVSNILGVIAAMRAIGVELSASVEACQLLTPVPGRMDCVSQFGYPSVVIDYAHTPDALENALKTLRYMADQRQGRLVCVFGCGGNRDASKRPLMASIAEKYADTILVTSDNSRNENPTIIFNQILSGFSEKASADLVPDRAQAIARSISVAGINDVILIAGKGHENYQEIAGEKHFFSDKEHALSALSRRSPQ